LHSCWCILLFDCGLNSNSYLNSNLFELDLERRGIEIRKKNPKQPNPSFSPRPISFPAAQSGPAPSPSFPSLARPKRLSPSPLTSGPASPHPGPYARPGLLPRRTRSGPVQPAIPARPAPQPASTLPCLTPLTPRTHCQPAQARPQSARPARPTLLSLTRWPHPPGSPSTSRNGCARPAEIPGETTGGFLPQPRPQSPASLL
jgi:hypothetical protein